MPLPDVIVEPATNSQMIFSGSMYTLTAPHAAVGALLGSFVACGEIPVALSGGSGAPVPYEIIGAGQWGVSTTPAIEDLAPRDITASEFAHWARSMAGGDTSEMLDI